MRASWGRDFALYTDHNVLATQRLLEAARRGGPPDRGLRLVVVRLRRRARRSRSGRTGRCQPVSPYGVTKLAGEHLAVLYHRNHGLPTVSLRFFTVYGPRQRPDMAFHRFLKAARDGGGGPRSSATAGRPATSPSSRTSWPPCGRPPLSGRPGSVYNVGGGERDRPQRGAAPHRERHRAASPHPARGGPEGRHERHLRRHHGRPPRPRLPLHGPPRRGARPRVGVDPGAALEAAGSPLAARCSSCRPAAATSSTSRPCRAPPTRSCGRPGQKAVEKKDWESARQYFRRIIDAFPQSEHQPDARLALADSYFEEGGTANYVLAVSSYREFLTLYPQHPKSDYAQFRVGESYFKQKNSPDRDQTATQQALEEYQRLLDVYPESHLGRAGPREDPGVPAEPRPRALQGRLLLPEDAPGLALGHRALRDDRLRLPRLREVRRGPLPSRRVPRERRALRRGPALTWPACRPSSRRARSCETAKKLEATFPPAGRPRGPPGHAARAAEGGPPPRRRRPPAPPTAPPPGWD